MCPADDKPPRAALAGITVLDLSRVLAGPWASQLLADYGATVIKVEKPGTGDDTRHWGPPWLVADGEPLDAAYFLGANRNKRSLAVDFAHPDGRRVLRELATGADVLIENFRVGTLGRYGLDYEALQALNTRLVYCSITAYGQHGSRAGLPGYDAMIQAAGGLMSITGDADEDGGRPVKVGVAIADIMAGMYAVSAIQAALIARAETGLGQHLDVPLYDSQVAWLANQSMNYLLGGEVPGRLGTAHPNIVPYQAFETADGHVMVAVGNDAQFRACAACLGLQDLADDTRFAANEGRVRHREPLVSRMQQAFLDRPSAHWLEALAAAGIPAAPINDIGTVLDEPYAAERQLVRNLPHAVAGEVPTVANPVRMSGTPVVHRSAAPRLGEHTDEILIDRLGYTQGEVDALRAAGAIG